MMRKIVFITGLLFCSIKIFAQQNKDEFKVMIDSAIGIKHSQIAATFTKESDKDYFDDLYLINEQNQPLDYLYTSNRFKLKPICIFDDRNIKILEEGIFAWKVLTMLNKNRFVIDIIDFHITRHDHNYNFSNGGGSTTIFEYSCDKNEWVLISSKNQGI